MTREELDKIRAALKQHDAKLVWRLTTDFPFLKRCYVNRGAENLDFGKRSSNKA